MCMGVLCTSGTEATAAAARGVVVGLLSRKLWKAKQLYQIHGFMLPRGLHHDYLLLSKFILVCCSPPPPSSIIMDHHHSLLNHAYTAFTNHQKTTTTTTTTQHIHLYNTMIKALSPLQPHHSIFVYNQLLQPSSSAAGLLQLRPDSYSIPFALKAVVRLSDMFLGRQIHSHSISTGLDCHVHVGTALIQMYSSLSVVSPHDARKLFDGMCFRDVASWNAMVAGYAKVGDVDNARCLFEAMPHRNVISWTALIAGYVQAKRPSEAIITFQRMQLENVDPDEVAMLAALSACADLGALELGEWIHSYITKYGLYKTVSLNNALIDMYAKSGNIRKAKNVFENMKHKSVVTWTTMIAGLALHGLGREALEMFSRMERAKIKPNGITFIAVLSACSHVGLVEMGRWYFNSMESVYGVKPKIEHYGCVVDLLGRAGCLQEAQELVKEMPFEANEAIWGSLLAASRIHSDVELGEHALQHLIQLEPNNSGNYTILSNIYAGLGQWNEAGMMRKVMRDAGVKKIPGGSYIEVNNRVGEFNARDSSHPQSERVYNVLFQINKQLKMVGDTNREYLGLHQFDEGSD